MKPYMIPTIRVRTVNVEPLLAGSPVLPYSTGSGSSTNESLSKFYDDWEF